MNTLLGEDPERDLFTASYHYTERDFEDLLRFRTERYHPEKILKSLKKERKRLQNLKKIHTIAHFCDKVFHTNSEERLRYRGFLRAEEKLFWFATMRDQGAKASLTRKRSTSKKCARRWSMTSKEKLLRLFESPDEFARIGKEIYKTEDKESFIWLHSYIRDFIDICPKSYLENGIFGKFMRSVYGIFSFSRTVGNTDYAQISRLSGYFAATYLFDDILDDVGYKKEEKEHYFRSVLEMLNGGKSDNRTFSEDSVMAFSEHAFAGIRDILDEKRGRMVAKSYFAIAKATDIGSHWNYNTPLTNNDLYSIATIKAAYTRIIPGILAGHEINADFISHCMRGGLIYQLTDDLRDIPDDLAEANITPFNYYRYGVTQTDIHPTEIFLAAISRISEENLADIPDACDLWIMRMSHSLRLLKLKYGDENLRTLFSEMNFPDNDVTAELAMIGECSSVIFDLEAEAAKLFSDIAVTLRGGWSKEPVYGH